MVRWLRVGHLNSEPSVSKAQSEPKIFGPKEPCPPLPTLLAVLARYRADDGSWPDGLVNLRWLIAEATRRARADVT